MSEIGANDEGRSRDDMGANDWTSVPEDDDAPTSEEPTSSEPPLPPMCRHKFVWDKCPFGCNSELPQ